MERAIPRHLVWSTDTLDLRDPFQRQWLLRQTLLHGTAADIRGLDFDELQSQLESLDLPGEIGDLWRLYFERRHARTRAR